MAINLDWKGRRVAILGMARTGMAVARALSACGAEIVLHDIKPASELQEAIREARSLGIDVWVGDRAYRDIGQAEAIIPSPGVPANHPVLEEALRRGIPIYSEIEVAYRLSPAPILAITGTNGKTTTTVALGEMLKTDGRPTQVAGNISAGEMKKALITAACEAAPESWIVAEISTFQLEWIDTFRPKVGALLNITEDHLDRHPSFEAYAHLKARLFENQTPDDVAVLNVEDPVVQRVTRHIRAVRLGFSRLGPLEAGCYLCGDTVCVRWQGKEIPVFGVGEVRLPGLHNLENLMAAAAMAIPCGVRPEAIAEVARTFRGVVHRLEEVALIGGVRFINNSMCTNPAAAARSVEAFDAPVVLIAGGKDKGMDFRPMAEAIARKARHLVLIGESAPKIEAALRDCQFNRISLASSMEEAVRQAFALSQPGDVVLMSPGCASFDMFANFETRGEVFKAAVHALHRKE